MRLFFFFMFFLAFACNSLGSDIDKRAELNYQMKADNVNKMTEPEQRIWYAEQGYNLETGEFTSREKELSKLQQEVKANPYGEIFLGEDGISLMTSSMNTPEGRVPMTRIENEKYDALDEQLAQAFKNNDTQRIAELNALQDDLRTKIINNEDVSSFIVPNSNNNTTGSSNNLADNSSSVSSFANNTNNTAPSIDSGSGYAGAIGNYDDSYLSAYTNAFDSDSTESKEAKKYFVLLGLSFVNIVVAFMPIWILTYSAIKNVSAAPMNEHYQRVIQAEPISYYINTFFVLLVAVFVWKLFISFAEITFLESYAPLVGENGFSKELWTIEVPDEIKGRYGAITLNIMEAISILSEFAKLLAYLTAILLLASAGFFTYTYFSSMQVGASALGVLSASFIALVVYVMVSGLYDVLASPVLNSDDTILSLARVYIQEGLDYFMEGEI